MSVHTKFEVRSFTRSWDNRGYLKLWAVLQLSSIACDHRNAQQRSSDSPQPADGVYETPNPTGQDDQRQYDVIQLGHTQHGPDAGHYDSLSPDTQGERHQYDAISSRQRDYLDVMWRVHARRFQFDELSLGPTLLIQREQHWPTVSVLICSTFSQSVCMT